MRTLRVVIAIVGGAPLITASFVLSDCARDQLPGVVMVTDAAMDRSVGDLSLPPLDASLPDWAGVDLTLPPCPNTRETHVVPLPPPGVLPQPGQLCAVNPPAVSNTSARITFTHYDPQLETADAFVAVDPAVLASIVGMPTITVTDAHYPQFAQLQALGMRREPGGFSFKAKWPPLPHFTEGAFINVKTTFTITCGDAGTQLVESNTPVSFCLDEASFQWVSSGDSCTVCSVIAEMVPSPIVPDITEDDLPLARVIRIAVREIARAARSVLLLAENDGGEDAEYEWRVSSGTLQVIDKDVVLWTLPDGVDRPFGQVAVWNDQGASVENFLWAGI